MLICSEIRINRFKVNKHEISTEQKVKDNNDEICNPGELLENVSSDIAQQSQSLNSEEPPERNQSVSYNINIERIHLKIDRQRFIKECQESFSNPQLPLIPVVIDDSTKHWPDLLKIILIPIDSKGAYVGVKCGYDQNKLFVILKWLNNELIDNLTNIVIQYCMELQIKEFILEPMVAMSTFGSLLSFEIMMRKYNKWVRDIDIIDFNQEIEKIADHHRIDFKKMKKCFDVHRVDYLYPDAHTRKEFIELLRKYGIRGGPAAKVFLVLSEKKLQI